MELKRQLGLYTGILIIVADMIGTGIFMTTGNVLGMTGDARLVLLLWGSGGLVSHTGTLCTPNCPTWPDVGREYVYLKKIFGCAAFLTVGYLSSSVFRPWRASSLLLNQYVNILYRPRPFGERGRRYAFRPMGKKGMRRRWSVFFGLLHIQGVRKGAISRIF